MATKLAVMALAALAVRALLAQAPAAAPTSDTLAKEETDPQGYKYQVPHEGLSKGAKGKQAEIRVRNEVRQILSGQTSINDPANRLRFRSYFLQYLFPLMTTEEGLKSISKDRQDFFRDVQNAKSPDAHREVIDLTLNAMKAIVQDKYRPQSRYNAMLIISSLNDQEANSLGVPQTLPEPMRAAAPFILQQFQKADNPDAIKLAALLGLARHLEWENFKEAPSTSMQPALKAEIIKALTALADEKQPPPGRDPEPHNWMRRRAIEALSMACLKRSDAGIAATMDKLLKDESEPLNVRFTVASVLGKMALQAPAKIDPVTTSKELGYMALLACENELTRAENYRKNEFERDARLTGTYSPEVGYGGSGEGGATMGMPGPGMRGPGMYGASSDGGGVRPLRPTAGGMPGDGYGESGTSAYTDPSTLDPKHYRVEFLRRRLRQQLYAVQLGLTGGDDHVPPKNTPGGGTTSNPTVTTTTGGQKTEPKGLFAIANEAEKKEVDAVYYKVRKLIEAIESPGPDVDFYQLIKDVRKEMKPLETLIGKRVPPPGAATEGTNLDDVPSIPAKGSPAKGPAAKGPVAPGPAKGGKSASRPPRSQPSVFGQPRFNR